VTESEVKEGRRFI